MIKTAEIEGLFSQIQYNFKVSYKVVEGTELKKPMQQWKQRAISCDNRNRDQIDRETERERFEDVTLLELKLEDGGKGSYAKKYRYPVETKNEKRTYHHLEPPGEMQPCLMEFDLRTFDLQGCYIIHVSCLPSLNLR